MGSKRQLRAGIRAARGARAARADRDLVADRLRRSAQEGGLLDPDGGPGGLGPVTITAYVASPGEPEVSVLRAAVRAAGGTVLLPIPTPSRTLMWAPDDGRYVPYGAFPVLMPAGAPVGTGAACLVQHGVGLVLVPALAVDRSGTRLGQGGGYYDRLLADLPASIAAVAVVHDEELLDAGSIPREEHDVPVSGALTPSGVVRFGSGSARG